MTEFSARWLSPLRARARSIVGVLATFAHDVPDLGGRAQPLCRSTARSSARYEITEKYLMVAAIFLGLSYGYRGGLFIRVTFLVDRLSGTARLAADYFAHPGVAGVLRCSSCGRPAIQALARAARRHRAEHAADPGRPGLLPRADRLSRADRPHAGRSAARAAAASRCCSRKRRPPPPERRGSRKISWSSRCRCWCCCCACCSACRSPWRSPAPACSASG